MFKNPFIECFQFSRLKFFFKVKLISLNSALPGDFKVGL